jgi:nucleoside-diphosphate-sugar epimerase
MRRKEIRVINMQLEHFYGPGAGSTNFITNMMDKLKNHYPQIDLTSGEQHRDFIYIDDVVNAYLIVIAKQEQFTEHYSSFQVSSNECLTIMELLVMMKTITGSRSILNFGAIPYRENELMNSFSDNSQLALLGWSPQVKISEGLLKTYTLN